MKKTFLIIIILSLVAGFLYIEYKRSIAVGPSVQFENTAEEMLPTPTSEQTIETPTASTQIPVQAESPNSDAERPVTTLLESVDHDVPFTPQAPTANWDAFHEEACEEASTVMAWHYFNKTTINATEQAEREMEEAAVWERREVGTDVSITAAQTVRMLREHFKLDAEEMVDPAASDLKAELSSGHLIIVPAQGQFLKNPYFKQPGPRYHMLVIRGFDGSGRFITNDPGTKRGERYQYSSDTLLNAIHDWNNGDVENGAKKVVVVKGLL